VIQFIPEPLKENIYTHYTVGEPMAVITRKQNSKHSCRELNLDRPFVGSHITKSDDLVS